MEKNKFSLEEFKKIDWNATLPDDFSELIEKDKKDEKDLDVKSDINAIRKKTQTVNQDENMSQDEEKISLEVATEVKRILKQKKEAGEQQPKKKKNNTSKKVSKPKATPEYFKIRYTAPKERGIIARIINQMKYENGWYDDIEDYLNDEYNFVYDDIEWSKNAEKRRDRRLYKRVQAYEDAEDDVTMKKAFLTVKVTTAAALIAALGLSVNFLYNEVSDLIHNSSYVVQAQEKSTLANANSGQIEYAERVLAKIDYNFEHLSHTELLDTVIRVGSKPSKITANRAMATMKNAGEFADQKLLEEIIQEAYETEYSGFSAGKKQELNQLIYEMLDDEVKAWIRNPEDVAKRNDIYTIETDGTESER